MTALAEGPTSIPSTSTDGEIRLGAVALRRAFTNGLLFAGTDFTLPVLNALHLLADGEAKTLVVTGTDRYKLLEQTVHLDDGASWDGILCRASVQEFVQAVTLALGGATKAQRVSLTATLTPTDKGALTLTVGRFTVESRTFVNGKFPSTERLFSLPRGVLSDQPVGLNPKQLAAFARVDAGPRSTLQMTVGEPTKPILFSGDGLRGLLMPVKLS